ncbi:hypothetical protein ACMFMF_008605 [Clarireedia jacksonii]
MMARLQKEGPRHPNLRSNIGSHAVPRFGGEEDDVLGVPTSPDAEMVNDNLIDKGPLTNPNDVTVQADPDALFDNKLPVKLRLATPVDLVDPKSAQADGAIFSHGSLDRFIDDGPQKPQETRYKWQKRVTFARRAMGIRGSELRAARRAIPMPTAHPKRDVDSYRAQIRARRVAIRENRQAMRLHRQKIDPRRYDNDSILYATKYRADKAVRVLKNAIRREQALQAARKFAQQHDGFNRPPTPQPPLDSSDEDIPPPFVKSYKARHKSDVSESDSEADLSAEMEEDTEVEHISEPMTEANSNASAEMDEEAIFEQVQPSILETDLSPSAIMETDLSLMLAGFLEEDTISAIPLPTTEIQWEPGMDPLPPIPSPSAEMYTPAFFPKLEPQSEPQSQDDLFIYNDIPMELTPMELIPTGLTPCKLCQNNRQKCDDNRPCGSCAQKDLGHLCVSGYPELKIGYPTHHRFFEDIVWMTTDEPGSESGMSF